MTFPASQPSSPDAYELLRRRCIDLGLPTWRANQAGGMIDEPPQQGLVGLWLRTPSLGAQISRAVRDMEGLEPRAPVEMEPGVWALIIPEKYRARVRGYTIALMLEPSILTSDWFAALCNDNRLDVASTRRALRPMATATPATVAKVDALLRWMVGDAVAITEQAVAADGFGVQLAHAYETIELMQDIGQRMSDPSDPVAFVRATIERLYETLDFAWIALAADPSAGIAPTVDGQFFMIGTPTMDAGTLQEACASLLDQQGRPDCQEILSDLPGFEPDGGPQVVIQPVAREGEVIAHLLVGEKGGLDPQVSSYDTQILETTAAYMGPFFANVALYEEQQAMFLGTIGALTAAIDAKDRYTRGHSARVALLSAQLAQAIGLDHEEVESIRIAGLVHDVGKIGVPEAILTKMGRLTDEEFEAIKLHPEIGYNILKDIPPLRATLPGVLYHHERYDGRGYPKNLAGTDIPLIARIICLADTFDAMSSTRSYRPAMPREKVLAEFERCAGTQFDPELVPAFVSLDFSEYDALVAEALGPWQAEQARRQAAAENAEATKAA